MMVIAPFFFLLAFLMMIGVRKGEADTAPEVAEN
jgi:hypothetical protein